MEPELGWTIAGGRAACCKAELPLPFSPTLVVGAGAVPEAPLVGAAG